MTGHFFVLVTAIQGSEQLVREALEQAQRSEGLLLKGTVKHLNNAKNPNFGIQGLGGWEIFEGGLEGELTARLGKDETEFEILSKKGETLLEVLHQRDNVVHRQTWKAGSPARPGRLVQELVQFLTYDWLDHAVRRAAVKSTEEETHDGKTILVIRHAVPKELLKEPENQWKGGLKIDLATIGGGTVKDVELESRIEKDTGRLVGLGLTVTREGAGFVGRIVIIQGGQQRDDANEKQETQDRIELKVEGFGPDHKPQTDKFKRFLDD